jgi:hypothetical protein
LAAYSSLLQAAEIVEIAQAKMRNDFMSEMGGNAQAKMRLYLGVSLFVSRLLSGVGLNFCLLLLIS